MTDSNPPKPKPRWFHFRLRTLLVLTFVVAVALIWPAWRLQQARNQQRAVAEIEKLGGFVDYGDGGWLQEWFGDGFAPVIAADIYDAKVADADLEHLERLTSLLYLALQGTQVTDAGLEHLNELTSLVTLDLRNTQVTDEGVRELQQALPNCRVIWAERPDSHEDAEAVNDLKQIGLAMHSYADSWRHFPPAVLRHLPAHGEPQPCQPYSWRVALLPYLGQQPLFEQYRFDEPWDSPDNKAVLEQMPDIYRHPEAPRDSTNAGYFVLVGPGTIFEGQGGTEFGQILDGTSNTILVVEANRDVPWTKPEDIPFDPEKALPELGGFSDEGFHALIADGSVRFIPETVDEEMLRSALQRADRQVVVWPGPPL